MSKELQFSPQYIDWLREVKERIRLAQQQVSLAANTELISFYWEFGKELFEKQQFAKWGKGFIERLSRDLKTEFPDSTGFSVSNLYNCIRFYTFYAGTDIFQRGVGKTGIMPQEAENEFLQRSVGKIPWRHNILIAGKAKSTDEALFYINQTIENGWSMDVLALQMKSGLYERQGKGVSNFSKTLPVPTSELARLTLKDPYLFDFVNLTEEAKERDIELQLIQHITRFLLELGKGFAFVGRQYCLTLNKKEYYLDLLFYHTVLKCFVVLELKNRDFEPEYAGKLNFYLTLVDKTLKRGDDNPTVGILLCRNKDNLEVEYALQDILKPMGVSEFTLGKYLPDEIRSRLPTIEEFEEELKKLDDE